MENQTEKEKEEIVKQNLKLKASKLWSEILLDIDDV